MSQYRFGAVSVTNGSNVVVGVGTSWKGNIAAGNMFSISGQNVWYTIQSVQNDTQITLATNFVGATVTGASYGIQRNFTPNQSYPIPSYGDQDTASLIAQTLLQLDAQMAALSPVSQALNGAITLSGSLTLSLLGGSSVIEGLSILDAETVSLQSSGHTQLTVSSAGVVTTELSASSFTNAGNETIAGSLSVGSAITAPSLSGNAGSASKLLTARSIALTGIVTGTVNFDGDSNVSLATTATVGPNGVALLDASGHLPLTLLPAAIQGAMSYQGLWDAATNTPALASGVGTKGYLYKVSVAGATLLDGNSQWNLGDQAVFNGATWDKWDGVSSEVTSVAGMIGNVALTSVNLTDSTTTGRALFGAANAAAAITTLGLSSSATVDTTNAANISSGVLPVARLPLATSALVGGLSVGANLTITAGVISLTAGNIGSALAYTPVNPGAAVALASTLSVTGAVTLSSTLAVTGLASLTTLSVSGLTTHAGDAKFTGTGQITVPVGTSPQRSSAPVNGMFRYNSDNSTFEGYTGGAWGAINGGPAIGDTPPATPVADQLWWNSTDGQGYIYYNGTWVQFSPFTGGSVTATLIASSLGYTPANAAALNAASISSGVVGAAYLPAPTATTLGAIKPDTTATISSAGLLSDAVGFRNRLINAAFNINQRGVSGTVTLAAGIYGHDHVKAGAAGCTYTFTITGIDTTLTITAGSLILPIEAAMIEGGVYTLSQAGTAPARMWQGTGSTGTGSYASGALTTSALTANTQTNIEFSTGTVLRPQLEPGSQATPFERRPIGIELIMCQRYYEQGTLTKLWGYTPSSGNTSTTPIEFKVLKRTLPTMATLYISANGVISGFNWDIPGQTQYSWYVTASGAGTYNISINWAASAEL